MSCSFRPSLSHKSITNRTQSTSPWTLRAQNVQSAAQSTKNEFTSCLIAQYLGAIFKDSENTPGSRIDDWGHGESRLLVAIYIGIYELAESSLTAQPATANGSSHAFKSCKDTGYQEVHRLVPRFQLRHTQDAPVRLSGVCSWESPFFDVDLLKSLISACESTHCMDLSPVQDPIHPRYFFSISPPPPSASSSFLRDIKSTRLSLK